MNRNCCQTKRATTGVETIIDLVKCDPAGTPVVEWIPQQTCSKRNNERSPITVRGVLSRAVGLIREC